MRSKKRITFIIFILISHIVLSQESKPILRIGLCADVQYCDCPDNNNRFYKSSINRLDSIVADFNQKDLSFSIHLGDIIDRDITKNLPIVLDVFNKSNRDVFHVLGNHDIDHIYQNGYKDLKGTRGLARVLEELSMKNTYYSFKRENVVFIILDSNDISRYSIDKMDPNSAKKEKEYIEMEKLVARTFRNNGGTKLDYNGGIGEVQMSWLDARLKQVEADGDIALIFVHQAAYPENGLQMLNNWEFLDTIDKYKCVKACFSGHHHPGDFAYYKNIPMITLEGVVETKSYAILNIYSDKLVLEGFGRTASRTLEL